MSGAVAAQRDASWLVDVQALTRAFGERVVIDRLSLQLVRGEFVALLGKSGCGKSTLLRALAGLDTGYTGRVRTPAARTVVFQEHRLMPWWPLWRNVAIGLGVRDARQRAERALEEVGLRGREQTWPVNLSGGEAQRVALARALVREPELLLLDEPFAALDALTRIKMHALVRALIERHRPAVILVTHDVDEAILLADRVLVMRDGHIAAEHRLPTGAARDRASPQAAALRETLLKELGVV
ncbi:MAG: ABC transporter ATP-binding protein [Polyangiales bacterium]